MKSGRVQKQPQQPQTPPKNVSNMCNTHFSPSYHLDPEQAQKSILAWRAAVPSSSGSSVCSAEHAKAGNRPRKRPRGEDDAQQTGGKEPVEGAENGERNAKLRAYMEFKWAMLLRYGG